MANPETIIISMRQRCTEVFEACQKNLDAVEQDRADLIAEKGTAFFTDWFDTVVGYDIDLGDMLDAITAMQTLAVTFESVRSKLQVVRTR